MIFAFWAIKTYFKLESLKKINFLIAQSSTDIYEKSFEILVGETSVNTVKI